MSSIAKIGHMLADFNFGVFVESDAASYIRMTQEQWDRIVLENKVMLRFDRVRKTNNPDNELYGLPVFIAGSHQDILYQLEGRKCLNLAPAPPRNPS